MKKLIFVIVIAIMTFAFSACGGNNSSTDNSSSKVTTTQEASQTEITTEEIIDSDVPTRLYYNKLYEHFVSSNIYNGEISKLDRSMLDGYEFIGVTASKVEYDEIPDKNLVSNLYEDGLPVFYNKAKDNFILWFQEDNYWVELVEFPIYE